MPNHLSECKRQIYGTWAGKQFWEPDCPKFSCQSWLKIFRVNTNKGTNKTICKKARNFFVASFARNLSSGRICELVKWGSIVCLWRKICYPGQSLRNLLTLMLPAKVSLRNACVVNLEIWTTCFGNLCINLHIFEVRRHENVHLEFRSWTCPEKTLQTACYM